MNHGFVSSVCMSRNAVVYSVQSCFADSAAGLVPAAMTAQGPAKFPVRVKSIKGPQIVLENCTKLDSVGRIKGELLSCPTFSCKKRLFVRRKAQF